MGDNAAITNLTGATAYNGYYWQGADTGINDFSSNFAYTGASIKSNWDYGITLSEDAIKEIVEKMTRELELAKITPDNGPEIPKWTGFLEI